MRTIIALILTIAFQSVFAQDTQTAMSKASLKKADSLYAIKKYSPAYREYYNAFQFDKKNQYAKQQMDSCDTYIRKHLELEEHAKQQARYVKAAKDKGIEPIFDDRGKTTSYKLNGETFTIDPKRQRDQWISEIEKEYWK